MCVQHCFLVCLIACVVVGGAKAAETTAQQKASLPRLAQVNFISNRAAFNPTFAVEMNFINAWGLAVAPAIWGKLGGALLVSNFGSGTIAAYDGTTRKFIDVLRDAKDRPVVVDKIWDILFGNGEGLGDKDALYFTAAPDDEKDGVFGVLRPVAP